MKLFFITLFMCGVFYGQNPNTGLDYYFSELESEMLDSEIPTPKEIIGHDVGKWHVTHDKLVQYMYALANSSEKVTIENRGETFEGRPILLLTITSKKNHANIDQIKIGRAHV